MFTRRHTNVAGIGLATLIAALALSISIATSSERTDRSRGLQFSSASGRHTALRIPGAPAENRRPSADLDYGKIRLAFEPNTGQSDTSVKFLAHGKGYALFLSAQNAIFALAARKQGPEGRVAANIVRMELLGANPSAAVTGTGIQTGTSNYFIGRDPKNWRTSILNYESVSVSGIYPGVDLLYYGKQRELEYDFKVAPRADASKIQIAFEGAEKPTVQAAGDLVALVGSSELRLHAPMAYQLAGSEKQIVRAGYLLQPDGSVSIRLGDYDHTRELIIDPILAYSTYLGGGNIDGANGIAVALDGTAFVAGGTFSADFPTAHALQPNAGGPHDFPQDAFVAKLSADGSTLLYSTFLGGAQEDVANAIAVDNVGNAYVTGWTLSPDFPVTPGSFNPDCGGDAKCGATWNPQGLVVTNAFVTKLNPAGTALTYSTFLGYYENVRGQAIAVDANQLAYVTGETSDNITPTVLITPPKTPPPPFPITGNASQPVYGGGATDVFLTVFSETGSSVLYSTYYGGAGEDVGLGIAADGSANAYLTGLTYSANLTTTGNGFQTAYGGAGDAFVAKINTASTGALLYSSYFGGGGLDQGNAIVVDGSGNAFVAGGTQSSGLATSPRPYNGEGDAFLAKLNPAAGSGPASLVYFTFLGGSLADSASGVAIDTSGNAYVTGSTVSPDFPATLSVFQTSYGGGNSDAFVTKIDPSGAILLYSSFLGGSNTDTGNSIAVDVSGSAYVAGQTCSSDFPLANPEQSAFGGNCDAFVSKVSILSGIMVNPAGLVFPASSIGSTSKPETVTITDGDSAQTINAVTLSGSNPGDFSVSNNGCTGALTPGQQCPISVTFSPLAVGSRTASLSIASTAPGSPLVVSLGGTTSTLTLSPTSLAFGNQTVSVASSSQTVIATNNGTTPITFSSIVASGDYSETDDCVKAPLQPGTNCAINVIVTPSTVGQSTGALTITDNAAGSPQVVLLTSTGVGSQATDFALSVLPSSGTVNAGQSESFTLTVTSLNGFAAPVALACAGVPPNGSCTLSPISVTPAANGTATSTVTVATGLRAFVVPTFRLRNAPPKWPRLDLRILVPWMLIAALFGLIGAFRRKRAVVLLGFCAATLAIISACNGGNASGVPAGTPAGPYQVTITSTSGVLQHTVIIHLQVN